MDSRWQRVTELPLSRWLRARPLVVDTALAVFVASLAVAVALGTENAIGGDVEIPETWWQWTVLIGATWMVPFRRVAPGVAVVLGSALQAFAWTRGFPDTFTAMAILIYSAAASSDHRIGRMGWASAGLLTLFTASGVISGEAPLYVLPIVGLFSAAAAAGGTISASRQAYAEAAEARALELERSRNSDRDRALVEERARIARELHDVVAHGLSVIVVQASAAQRILDRDPEGTASALHQIETTGRTALNEMRQVLGAIRTEPSESWQPAPGLSALDELVNEMRSTGLPVTIVTENGEDQVTDPLPATVDLTAYRIVQESLTNVLKHGGRMAQATVEISRQPRSLDIRVTDNGRGAVGLDGGGHGLQGMQERVEVFGGRFEAGPRPGGGFAVSVSLPLDGVDATL